MAWIPFPLSNRLAGFCAIVTKVQTNAVFTIVHCQGQWLIWDASKINVSNLWWLIDQQHALEGIFFLAPKVKKLYYIQAQEHKSLVYFYLGYIFFNDQPKMPSFLQYYWVLFWVMPCGSEYLMLITPFLV